MSLLFASIALTPGQTGVALSIYCYCLLSDLLDGYVARRWNLATRIGAALDGFADKALSLVSVLYLIAADLPAIPCLMVLLRDLLVLSLREIDISSLRAKLASRRLVGALTVAPVRLLTIALLFRTATDQPPSGALRWVAWGLGSWSMGSLLASVWPARKEIARALLAD